MGYIVSSYKIWRYGLMFYFDVYITLYLILDFCGSAPLKEALSDTPCLPDGFLGCIDFLEFLFGRAAHFFSQ